MAVAVLTKISSVLFVASSATANPRGYFGVAGSFQVSDDNLSVSFRLQSTNYPPQDFTCLLSELKVNGQTPSTGSEAKTLLNSIFGA